MELDEKEQKLNDKLRRQNFWLGLLALAMFCGGVFMAAVLAGRLGVAWIALGS